MPNENKIASLKLELAKLGASQPKLKDDSIVIPKSRMDAIQKLDSGGWINEDSGFGVKHATNNTSFMSDGRLGEPELNGLYRDDWVTRKGVDSPAMDMTRKGVKFIHTEGKTDEIDAIGKIDTVLSEEYQWMETASEAIKFSRLSGGCATFFNFGGELEDQKDPIDLKQVNDIKWIKNFPAWLAVPISWYRDFDHPKFLQPEHYQILVRGPAQGITVRVHESRLLIMQGRTTTPDNKALNRGWNDSYVQSAYTAVRDYGVAASSASATMESFTWMSLGIKGLADKVMHDPEDTIQERIFLAAQKLHAGNLSLYDSDGEAMEKKSTTVTGLDDLWDRFGDVICGAFDMPRSIFFSAESGSLGGNAAESDRTNYYDRKASEQELILRPWLREYIAFVGQAENISIEKIKFEFNPLREKSSGETIAERFQQAQTDQIYLINQVVTPEETAKSRFTKPIPDLDTMNVDFKEREEYFKLLQEQEANQEETRNLLSGKTGGGQSNLEKIKDNLRTNLGEERLTTRGAGPSKVERGDCIDDNPALGITQDVLAIDDTPHKEKADSEPLLKDVSKEEVAQTIQDAQPKDNEDTIRIINEKLDKLEEDFKVESEK